MSNNTGLFITFGLPLKERTLATEIKTIPYANPGPLNARQRAFCVNYASGMTLTDAYLKAGYPVDSAPDCASRLMQYNAKVKAYYNRLVKRKEDITLTKLTETIMSPKERQVRLSEIARARLVEFQDEDGTPMLTKDTPNNAAAKEFYHRQKHDRNGNPSITKSIKLTDPIAAIQELNKMDGSYAPSKHLIAQRVQFEVMMVERPKNELPEDVTPATEPESAA